MEQVIIVKMLVVMLLTIADHGYDDGCDVADHGATNHCYAECWDVVGHGAGDHC